VVTGLPVAGFSGSLGYRFKDKAAAGLGLVRAKTGTLTGVHGLAGIALTRSRQAMFFVAVADEVALPQTLEARADLDRAAAALTTCGC
jgi:D-alanyl-D-alanine carboxypeptidase/D-alanyl-D-alanine-endopeptidase (penicillin-binding protein 4)